jgi:hypothetical protein
MTKAELFAVLVALFITVQLVWWATAHGYI